MSALPGTADFAPTGSRGPQWAATTWYGAVETTFTAVFTQDLWSRPLRGAAEDWLGPAAVHYIEAMPGRKFRAVLPWLTVGCSRRLAPRCLAPELLFAVFYCLDDLTDRKGVRYGAPTAHAVHGRAELTRSLEQAGRGVPRSGRLAGLSGQLWDECLAEMTEGQSERQALTPEEFSWDRYVGAARRRTAFVGRAWVDALSAADQGQAAAFVTTAYPWCAEAGQLRNDLRNTTGREILDGGVRYSDLGEGKVTAVSGLLWQRADDVDRRWLRKHVWGRGRPSAEALVRVDRMVEHYAVISDVAVSTGRLVERIRAAIRTMDRPHARTVWDAWVTRQFEVGVHRAYGWGDASIPAFEAAVAGLRGSGGLENEDGGRS